MITTPASSRNHRASRRMPTVAALAAVLLVGPLTTRAETVFYITGVGCVSKFVLQQNGVIGSGCSGPIDQGYRI